jgi:hypothetical protein
VPLGPPTPAGPAFPAPPSGPQYRQQYPAYPAPPPNPAQARGRVLAVAAAYAVSAVVVIAAVAFLLTHLDGSPQDPSNTDAGSPGTQLGSAPNSSGGPATTTAGTSADLLTPAGARTAVGALTEVMGGSKVSELTLYPDRASATGPAKSVKNGFDDFQYRDGTATREGPDTVDADRAVLDLNTVNWDALPALWQRAEKDLGVDQPTTRYVIVDTSIIDGTPSLKLYLSDDYGAAYLEANLAGEVLDLFPRDG